MSFNSSSFGADERRALLDSGNVGAATAGPVAAVGALNSMSYDSTGEIRICATESPPNPSPIPEPESALEEDLVTAPHLSLWSLFSLFLWFGLNAWGGPAAQISMLQDHLVDKEKWITRKRFFRVYAVYQVLPGPEATELCCYFGFLSRGRIGAFLAGFAFVFPGFVLMIILSYLYMHIGMQNEYFAAAFLGIQPVIAAMVVRAVEKIGRNACRKEENSNELDWMLLFIAFLAILHSVMHINFAISLLLCGILFDLWKSDYRRCAVVVLLLSFVAYIVVASAYGVPSLQATGLGVAEHADYLSLFLLGLTGGLLTFGGAYTAIPFMRTEAVILGGWITLKQFMDGVALASILPAPLVIFSSFVGFYGGSLIDDGGVREQLLGSLVVTIGMFLPAFSFTIIGHPVFEKAIAFKGIHAFLDGIAAGVVGLVAVTALDIIKSTIITAATFSAESTNSEHTVTNSGISSGATIRAALSVILFVTSLIVQFQVNHRLTNTVLILSAAIIGQIFFLESDAAA